MWYLQELRRRGHCARMKGRRYALWPCGVGGVGVMVMEELCEKMMKVGGVSYRVMTVVVFEEDVMRLICGYVQQYGRGLQGRQCFYYELKGELDMHSAGDLVMCLGDFNGHIGSHADGFMEDIVWLSGILKEECYWSFVLKRNDFRSFHMFP